MSGADLPAPACRACGSADLDDRGTCRPFSDAMREFHDAEWLASLPNGSLYRCRVCGLGQRIPALTPGQAAAEYTDSGAGRLEYDFEQNGAWRAARRLLQADSDGRADVSVLDVGCNEGRFLCGLPASWSRCGMEPSRAARTEAETRGVRMVGEFLDGPPAPGEPGDFDAVCAFDVFEHLHDPVGFLDAMRARVRRGGLLIVGTGNMDAWTWRWFGRSHWYLDIPLHIVFGSPVFFRWYAAERGLEVAALQAVRHRCGVRGVCADVVSALYHGSAGRGGAWRVLRRLLLAAPGGTARRHRTSPPATFHLRDHVVVGLRRPGAG